MRVQILVDNPKSWIIPYAQDLLDELRKNPNINCTLLHKHSEVKKGDILCLLACEAIFKNLELNTHNLVVHESDLPKGKGWSPVTWQVLGGKTKIPVTLFEATKAVDAGHIYAQDFIQLNGTELLEDIKHQQGIITNSLILQFIEDFPNISSRPQEGSESFYKKRGPKDSKLDSNKTIAEQFNLLRVCDNERYPAFFELQGKTYILKIYEDQ